MTLLSLRSWLKAAKRTSGTSRRNPRRRQHLPQHRFVPRLETLETRTVLSGGYVFSTLDAPNAGTATNGIQGTFAVGINGRGQISGNYGDANNVTHGFLLRHGHYLTFDDPKAGTGAGQGTNAFGINARGEIVGDYIDANNVQHGFLRSGGQYTTIDDPDTGPGPFLFDQAVSINARGQIVGAYTDAKGTTHGYLLSGGQYTNVDDPNGVVNFCLGINASAQIVGNYTDAAGLSHGFLLSQGQYTTFDDPIGVQTLAGSINDPGQIVGTYLDANNVYHAFVLSGGRYTTLDDPKAGTGAFQGTLAFGINDSGKIVGFYYDSTNVIHGFLATLAQGNSASGSSLTKAGSSVNPFVAAGALSNATPPGTQAVSAASASASSRSDNLSGRTIAVVTVSSPSRGGGDRAAGRVSVVSAAAAAGLHLGVTVNNGLASTDDLFGLITLM
jgi:hypothetical protein